jgi:hypothetical protein
MLEEDWDEFPQNLREMLGAGLVVRRDNGTFAFTISGLLEIENERAIHRGRSDSATDGGNGAPIAARHPNILLIEPATSSPRE